MRLPPQQFAELSDDDALALSPGDVVLVQTVHGPAPLTVDRVRPGVAFDDANPPHPYEVPVIEGALPGRQPLVWAVPNCFLPAGREPDDESADAAEEVKHAVAGA